MFSVLTTLQRMIKFLLYSYLMTRIFIDNGINWTAYKSGCRPVKVHNIIGMT